MSRRVRILIQPSKELPCLLNYFLFFWRGLHIFIILTFRRGAWCLVLDAPALRVVVVGTTLVGGSNDAVRRMTGRPRPTTTVLRAPISSHLATRPSKSPQLLSAPFLSWKPFPQLPTMLCIHSPCSIYTKECNCRKKHSTKSWVQLRACKKDASISLRNVNANHFPPKRKTNAKQLFEFICKMWQQI